MKERDDEVDEEVKRQSTCVWFLRWCRSGVIMKIQQKILIFERYVRAMSFHLQFSPQHRERGG